MQAGIVITRRSRLHVAPEGFVFEVALSGFDTVGPSASEFYDPRFHELYYFWTFDDPYIYSAPVNIFEEHKNANISYGPIASHTFRSPGTYTVSCLVVEPSSGKTATASLDVVIGNPDSLFSGTNTLYVAPDRIFTNMPTGAKGYTTLDAALAAVAGQDTVPKRIMLKRGQSFTFSGRGLGGGGWPTCYIVAESGRNAKPSVSCTGGFSWNDVATTGNGEDKDFVLQNIEWFGPYDSTTNTGAEHILWGSNENPPNIVLIDGCLIDGFLQASYNGTWEASNYDHRGTIINDTTMVNYKAWCISDGHKANGFTAITGSCVRGHVDALVDSTYNQGGPLRSDGGLTIIHSSDFFVRQGWTSIGSYKAVQPCLRMNSETGVGNESTGKAKVIVVASSFESGFEIIQIKQSGGGQTPNGVNALFDKNYLLGSYVSYGGIMFHYGGITIRNNVIVFPDVEHLPTQPGPREFIAGEQIGTSENDAPVKIYNNTFVNLLSDANSNGDAETNFVTNNVAATPFTTWLVSNNIFHEPNVSSPTTTDAPLGATAPLWTPREKGYKSSTVSLQTQTATPSSAVALFAPLDGSTALGDALSEPVAYDGFQGNPRPPYPSRGALEMP